MRHDPEARKHRNVDFRLRKKPEEALPEYGQSVRRGARRLGSQKIHGREEMSAEEPVREQAKTCRQKNAEDEHAKDGVSLDELFAMKPEIFQTAVGDEEDSADKKKSKKGKKI